MKAEYIDEGVRRRAGARFPMLPPHIIDRRGLLIGARPSGCKCGMLYGPHSSVHRAEDVNAASLSTSPKDPHVLLAAPLLDSRDSQAPTTPLSVVHDQGWLSSDQKYASRRVG